MVVAATGFFDGVHAGHRAVLDVLRRTAADEGLESAVITFWPHPRTVLGQDAEALRLLNTLEEKKAIVRSLGIDRFYVIPFTKAFSRLDASSFLRDYLVDKYGVTSLVIGYDHRLGNASCTSQEELVRTVMEAGIRPVTVGEVLSGSNAVSSTKIRRLLSEGDVHAAGNMLGYPYILGGTVVLGNMIGRTIGFPTANIETYDPMKMIPGDGVYCIRATVKGGSYPAICNIGERPTVGSGNPRTVEAYIMDFNDDLYGADIKVEFIERIRDERKFDSMEALRYQISIDELFVRNYFKGHNL